MGEFDRGVGVDQLTQRELDILRLVAIGLSDKAIAARLVISLETVKWYNKQIYGKLQVSSRTQAVAVARVSGLLNDSSTGNDTSPEQRSKDASPVKVHSRAAITIVQQSPIVETVLESAPKVAKFQSYPAPDMRNRFAMLQNVRRFWIEGVLEDSLEGAALIRLGMKRSVNKVITPWNILLRKPNADDVMLPSGTNILSVYDKLDGKLLILGDPGSGKTTILLELARDLLDRAHVDEQHPIPVVLNLASWGAKCPPLESWLVSELNSRYQVPISLAKYWVEQDALLLLLDGLDEVPITKRRDCLAAINVYRQHHGFVDVIVCSRIQDYDVLSEKLRLNGAVVLQALDDKQISTYLTSLELDLGPLLLVLLQDEELRTLGRSPLMLSIMAFAYQGSSAEELMHVNSLEARRRHIFSSYVDTMFRRRLNQFPYTQSQTTHYLSWLAKKMSEQSQTIFCIENLQPDWLANLKQQKVYVLSVALIHGLSFGLFAMLIGIWLFTPQAAVIFGIAGTSILAFLNGLEASRSKIQPVEILQWSWSSLVNRLPRRLPSGLALGGMAFFAWWLTVGPLAGIVLGAVTVLWPVVTGGWVGKRVESKTSANEGFRRSLRDAWRTPVLEGLISLLFTIPSIGFKIAIAYALAVASSGAVGGEPLNKGSAAVVRHLVLRYQLYRDHVIPLDYANFLDWGVDRVLLRKVGGGYIFIHRFLLEYFASFPKN